MTIIEQLKNAHLNARKTRDPIAASILSVVIGDVQTKEKNGKNFTDADVIALLKSVCEDIRVSKSKAAGDQLVKFEHELATLVQFIPKQLTVQDIAGILAAAGVKSIPDAQKHMRANYAGTFNGADVNKAFATL